MRKTFNATFFVRVSRTLKDCSPNKPDDAIISTVAIKHVRSFKLNSEAVE